MAKKQAITITDPTFRKDPERWLKYQGWEDELISQTVVSQKADDKAWMFSDQGIIDKANELGVSSYGVANYHQLKEKVLFVLAKKAAE